MMRFWGAVLVVMSGYFVRKAIVSEQREQIAQLRGVIRSLRALQQDLRATLLPLPALLERRQAITETGFFRMVLEGYGIEKDCGLASAWIKAAEALALQREEKVCIAGLADSFSAPEEMLLRSCAATVQELEERLAERETALRGRERLIGAGCFSISAMVAVLLL